MERTILGLEGKGRLVVKGRLEGKGKGERSWSRVPWLEQEMGVVGKEGE